MRENGLDLSVGQCVNSRRAEADWLGYFAEGTFGRGAGGYRQQTRQH